MNSFAKRDLLLVIVFIFSGTCFAHSSIFLLQNERDHPFLITREDNFQKLREKAFIEPWRSMKTDAITETLGGLNPKKKYEPYELQDFTGAVALSYILDPENSKTYAFQVRDLILENYSNVEIEESTDWGKVVPPMSSFFVAILALDIVHDSLTEEDIRSCEEVIASQIFKIDRKGSWEDVRRGTHGTWDIYSGKRTTPDDEYFQSIMHQITPDGVSPVTIHYAWERVGGGDSRISKAGYMDVLEFTGIDKRYYNNEKLIKFHRWLFGSSVNNSKEMAIIGDMLPTQEINNDLLHRRVGNFDEEAAAYAAWFHEGVKADGHIISYILPHDSLPLPKVPGSHIYSDGGAFFRESANDPDGIHVVLYNILGQEEWHTHQEVNGLALSGLGNRLLVNGGRLGEPTRAAALNNTLTINGQEHQTRTGGGIVEGMITTTLDFASGEAGSAFADGVHHRNLLLMHANGNAKAYALILDEVGTEKKATIHTYLHPANESQVSSIVPKQEYVASIDHFPSVRGTELAFFYVTPPSEVNITKVPSAVPERYPDYPDHSRLEAVYGTEGSNKKNIITVLSPFTKDRNKLSFTRISMENGAGGEIRHSDNLSDYILESNAIGLNSSFEDTEFTGGAVLFRKKGEALNFYFVRKASRFIHLGEGFRSNHPLTLFLKEGKGQIIVYRNSRITIFSKNISGIHINGRRIVPEEINRGYAKIDLEEGNHKISIVRSSSANKKKF